MSGERKVGPVQVQGRPLRCNVCSHDTFWEHELQLATSLFNFLDANPVAQCAVCERCGYVHMFIPQGTVRADDAAPAPDVQPGVA